jgi:hypothetical protein
MPASQSAPKALQIATAVMGNALEWYDQASGGEAHPGFGHVQSGHRQQATRLM